MSSDVVTLEVSDYVAVATLNRPPVNAVNWEMRERLIEIFDQATDREDIRAVVLTAQGKARLKQCPPEDRFRAMGYRSRSGCFHYIIA